MDQPYEENQRFALWVYIMVGFIWAVSIGAIVSEDDPGVQRIVAIAVTIGVVLLLNILALRVRVDASGVTMRLGALVPMIWKRIPLNEIRRVEVVTYRPLLDAGGWGMRFGRFDGQFTIYYNARGNRGVLLETHRRRFIIGSQCPEDLAQAIASRMNP